LDTEGRVNGEVILWCLKLGNCNLVLNWSVLITKRFPSRSQTFAVTTPASEEFDEDILRLVHDDLFECLSNDGVDVALSLGNRLALEGRLKFTSEVLFDPCLDEFGSDFLGLIKGVLELFGKVLGNEGRPLGLKEIEGTTMFAKFDSVNPDEVHLGLKLLGDFTNFLDMFILVLGRRVEEKVCEWLLAGGVNGVIVTIDLVNNGDGEVLDPVSDLVSGEFRNWEGVFSTGLVEAAVNDKGRGLDTSCGSNIRVSGETKEVVLAMLFSNGTEDRGGIRSRRRKVGDNNDLVRLLERLMVC